MPGDFKIVEHDEVINMDSSEFGCCTKYVLIYGNFGLLALSPANTRPCKPQR